VIIAERKRWTTSPRRASLGRSFAGKPNPRNLDPKVEVAGSETDLFDTRLSSEPLACPEEYPESLLSLLKMKFE